MKALLLAAAILAASSSALFAQGADTPFAGVDPNASQPFVATEEARNQLQAEIFKNPGSFDPQWIQIHANALRADGRHTDADGLALFAALRKSTYARVCQQASYYYGQRVRNPYEAAIADLVYFQKFGRRSVDLKPALDVALRLDATAPFAYRPVDDWCPTAFDRVPKVDGSGEQKVTSNGNGTFLREWVSIKLRDEASFHAEHARQRDWLRQTTFAVIEAERISASKKLPPFAAGLPGSAGTPLAQSFLKVFKPTRTLTPQNGEPLSVGTFRGISADGSAIMYQAPAYGTYYYVQLANQKREAIEETAHFIAGKNVPTFINFSTNLCDEGTAQKGACAATIRYSARSFEDTSSSEFALQVTELDSSLDWRIWFIDYDRLSGVALVKLGAVVMESAANDRQAVKMSLPVSRAFVVIDILKGKIIGTATERTAPEILNTLTRYATFGFALDGKGQPILVSVDLKRVGAEVLRYNMIERTKETSSLSHPTEIGNVSDAAHWITRGLDYTPAISACEKYEGLKPQFGPMDDAPLGKHACFVVGITPDRKYWLLDRRLPFVGGSMLLIRADNLEVAGVFETGIFVSYVQQSASDRPFVFLMRLGPNLQAYEYDPTAK